MIAAAITLYDLVSPGSVVTQHGPYGDPAFPTTGSNTTLAPTTDQPTEDAGIAGVIGWTQPALAATELGVNVPGVGVGTNVGVATTCNYPDPADVRAGVDRGDGVLGTAELTDVDELIDIVLEAVGNPCKDEEAAGGG